MKRSTRGLNNGIIMVMLALAMTAAECLAGEPPGSLNFNANPDGSITFGNGLFSATAASAPGAAGGILKWKFTPTGFEMIDVLYGQTDYVKGHILGEKWDPVELKGTVAGGPKCGSLYVTTGWGVTADGRGAKIVQEAQDTFRLRRTFVLRRDWAALEIRYELANISADPTAFALRLHTAMSPGARGQYESRDNQLFLDTVDGVLALDQSLNQEQYHQQYKNDKFFFPAWSNEPPRSWVGGKLTTPALAGNWAALVNRKNGDGMALVIDETTLVGYYNCPGITVEPVFRAIAPAKGDAWQTAMFVGTFSGAKDKSIAQATPLYLATAKLESRDGDLAGELIPLFAGKLKVVNGAGKTVFEAKAAPAAPLALKAAVAGAAWRVVAEDTQGALIGSVASDGKVELAEPEVTFAKKTKPSADQPVYVASDAIQQGRELLKSGGVTIYCDWAEKDEVKDLARKLARGLGLGLAWTNPGGKLLVVGSADRNALIRDMGLLKNSLSKDWPGPGKGAVLYYANLELTQQPVLVAAGSDAVGALAAGNALAKELIDPAATPHGFAFWASAPDQKVYPYTRPPADVPEKIVLEAARGEYEPAQLAITAYDDLKDAEVTLEPLVNAETGKALSRNYATPFRKKNGPLWLRWVNYFPVEPKDGWTGHPDPLLSRPERNLAAGRSQALWLTAIVPEDAPPGVYTGGVKCVVGGESKRIPLELRVWDFALPREGLKGEPYMHLANFAPDDRRHLQKRHVDALVQNLVEHGMRVIHLGPSEMFRWHFSPENKYKGLDLDWLTVSDDGAIAMDASYFDWLVTACDEAAKPFDIQYLLYMQFVFWENGAYGEFKKAFPKRFEGRPAREGHPFQDYYSQELLTLLKKHLEKKGLLNRLVLKIADEPRGFDVWYDTLTVGAREAGLPIMTCFNSIDWKSAERGLGKLALWQPLYMHYDPVFFKKAREAGGLISWYNCGPPPKTSAGTTASELRAFLWQAAKADLDIVCWWGIQCWGSTTDLWRDRYSHWNSVMYPEHPMKPAYLEKGKGWLDTSPLDSIRWELIREGMEDAWYVNLLRRRIAEARQDGRAAAADKAQAVLDGIWADVFPTLNDYNPPYAKVMASRRNIAAAIMELGAGSPPGK